MIRNNLFPYIDMGITKMQAAGDILKSVAIELCRHVDQKIFNDAIISLGLLSESDLLQWSDDNMYRVHGTRYMVPVIDVDHVNYR